VLILDGTGRLLEANALAVEHLRACNGIRLRADRTVSLREPAGVMLDRWIATGVPPTDNRDGLLHARRPLSLPLSIMVVALPPPRSAWISGDPRWMLMVFDPERRALASASLIAADLGISEREAELAALLAAGMEIDQVARRLGISLHTARTHLKSIYSKTGIGSRAELVRRICVGPSVLPGS